MSASFGTVSNVKELIKKMLPTEERSRRRNICRGLMDEICRRKSI